jgi:hypothetical protein
MDIKAIKFLVLAAFLFSLAYMNKDEIPRPQELNTFDFVLSSGIDISPGRENSAEKFSISYISRSGDDIKSSEKNIFNVKSGTLNGALDKLHNLTNKSVNDSHLEYILIGEETARENLGYFIDYYSRRASVRLDVKAFITKDMKSEDFIRKVTTSKIDADEKLKALVNNKNQLSFMTAKNLRDERKPGKKS